MLTVTEQQYFAPLVVFTLAEPFVKLPENSTDLIELLEVIHHQHKHFWHLYVSYVMPAYFYSLQAEK
jgi:hypothetical protein